MASQMRSAVRIAYAKFRVIPTIESHQGRVVAFDEEPEVVEGSIEHPRTVILEFLSMTAFHAWYDSPEYQEILPLRLKSIRGTLIVADFPVLHAGRILLGTRRSELRTDSVRL
jgi:uncharacterized protein (DUF1330 family)